MKRTVRVLYHLPWNILKKVPIKAALIVVGLCHPLVSTSSVKRLVNHAMNIVMPCGLNLRGGRRKIHLEVMIYIPICIIHHVMNVSCIAFRSCFTSWIKLVLYYKLTSVPARRMILYWHHNKRNEFRVDFINKHLSFIPICCTQQKYVRWIWSTFSVAANWNLHS